MSAQHGSARATGLRESFDRTFAQAPILDEAAMEDLLAIGLGGTGYAIRLAEIAGVHGDKRIVRLPTPSRFLLGLAGFRGATLPVYDLRLLLGLPADQPPRWLAVAVAAPVALAFETVDAHLRVGREAIASQESRDAANMHLRELVRAQGSVRAIVDLESVISTIKAELSPDKS